MKKLFAIAVIWAGCAVAWMMLGSTIVYRSGDSQNVLVGEVLQLWGAEMRQAPPSAQVISPVSEPARTPPQVLDAAVARPGPSTAAAPSASPLASPSPSTSPSASPSTTPQDAAVEATPFVKHGDLVASDIDVSIDLEQRKKGLMWFATYAVSFRSRYTFRNPSDASGEMRMHFPLAGTGHIYDAFQIVGDDGEVVEANVTSEGASWVARFDAGQSRSYRVLYRSRGTKSWSYSAPTNTAKISNFKLEMEVNTEDVNFAAGTVSPSEQHRSAGEWKGTWTYDSLVASAPITLELPEKLNPGPLAAKITFFAPVSLLFFFFVVAILAAHRRKDIHPMNYFFLGCSFFAFHLLFAYTVDHVAVTVAFGVSAAVSTLLVTSYSRLFVGWRFALLEVGGSQLIYLVLFSFTFFWTGMTGLAVTIGAVLTLFVIMQITGRTRWAEVFANMRPPGVGGTRAAAPNGQVAAER